MSEWINIKDRLPNDNEEYLTCDEYKVICLQHYLPSLNSFSKHDATHWMPLPKLPK